MNAMSFLYKKWAPQLAIPDKVSAAGSAFKCYGHDEEFWSLIPTINSIALQKLSQGSQYQFHEFMVKKGIRCIVSSITGVIYETTNPYQIFNLHKFVWVKTSIPINFMAFNCTLFVQSWKWKLKTWYLYVCLKSYNQVTDWSYHHHD